MTRMAVFACVHCALQLVATEKYEHFNMYFNNPDWELFIQRYVNAGGIAKELIECVHTPPSLRSLPPLPPSPCRLCHTSTAGVAVT